MPLKTNKHSILIYKINTVSCHLKVTPQLDKYMSNMQESKACRLCYVADEVVEVSDSEEEEVVILHPDT